jgi:hypothetical protein
MPEFNKTLEAHPIASGSCFDSLKAVLLGFHSIHVQAAVKRLLGNYYLGSAIFYESNLPSHPVDLSDQVESVLLQNCNPGKFYEFAIKHINRPLFTKAYL